MSVKSFKRCTVQACNQRCSEALFVNSVYSCFFSLFFFLNRYVAQVYYLITKIKWEYDTPANILKGGTVMFSHF